MQTLLLGTILILGVFVASIEQSSLANYWQAHSLLLVFGGTLAVLFLSNTKNVLRSTLRGLRSLGSEEPSIDGIRSDLLKLIQNREHSGLATTDPLVRYAMDLWAQGVDSELFIVLVSQKKQELETKTLDAVQALKNLAKYPPALGMVGTVMGMISLFAKLDQNKSNLGVSLSIAMTATFFGLILTNAVLSPIADRLHVKHVSEKRYFESVYEILLLINRGEPATLIQEEMNHRAA